MNRSLALRVLTALALVGVAVVHLSIAKNYVDVGKHPLALSDQFYVQAASAILIGLALVIRPHLLVWLAALGFAFVSLAVLVYSRSHTIPVYGFPPGFQESWDVRGAKPAAYFETAALVLSAVGAALSLRAFRQARSS
ncbi:MAG: hypothetical protein JWN31_1336 [Frankiales bacterium]|nr:hypothetical protein [Frankiales bacterium]